MALTPEQEAKVLQIITAFDNGKRLNELPHIGEVNPLELIVEVMDTDGESKQAKLATMLPYLEDQCHPMGHDRIDADVYPYRQYRSP